MAIIPTNGEFSKVPDGGRPGPFIVTVTVDGTSVTADKTGAQIKAAIDAGLSIYAERSGDYFPIMMFIITDDALSYIQFGYTYYRDGSSYVYISYNSRDGWLIEEV